MPVSIDDLHGVGDQIARATAHLRSTDSGVPRTVARAILEFVEDKRPEVGPHQLAKYLHRLPVVAGKLGSDDFLRPNRETPRRFFRVFSYPGHEWSSIKTTGSCLVQFWKWRFQKEGADFPSYLKITVPNKKLNRKTAADVLTPEEVSRLVEATSDLRYKALIWVLFETGGRIGEIMPLRVRDVEPQPAGWIRLRTHREKGADPRPAYLLENAVPALLAWLEQHPRRNEPNAPLWAGITDRRFGEPIEYRTVVKMLSTLARRQGVTKPVNPHSFRHSRATEYAKNPSLSPAVWEKMMGWQPGSAMTKIYQHLSGSDVEDAVLRAHGLQRVPGSEALSQKLPKTCGRCRRINSPDARFCTGCGGPVDPNAMLQLDEMGRKVDELAELLESPEARKFLAQLALNKGIGAQATKPR
jgi:integrase